MQERKTIFYYIYMVFAIFGFTMIVQGVFTKIFGADAQEVSSLFQLGSSGIAINTMLQFLVFSIINVVLQHIFFTDKIIKNLSHVFRTIYMVVSILTVSALFIIIFKWFPVNMWEIWLIFLVCFIICFVASTILTVIKEKLENQRLAEGLAKLKEAGGFNEYKD